MIWSPRVQILLWSQAANVFSRPNIKPVPRFLYYKYTQELYEEQCGEYAC